MILLNVCDPANPFRSLFPVTDPVGQEKKFVRVPTKYLVVQAGQPLLLYEGRISVLADLSAQRAEQAVRTLMQAVDLPSSVDGHRELSVCEWNGHPIDVSPARHLLLKLGFVQVSNRWKGFVYDGAQLPNHETLSAAGAAMPDSFEHEGKETAPVRYDAEWVVSRSDKAIRSKVRELISWLEHVLPKECAIAYNPRGFTVRYRGLRCMNPYLQRKQIYLQITHKGWTRGIQITPETDLDAPEFASEVFRRFDVTRQQIDALLDAQRARARPLQI
jgi:hypothetical protein